jgi:predicted nucleotidyltransferase
MNRELALDALRGARHQLEARGIAHAAIFGSVARDISGSRSDIDIAVTPAPNRRLDLIDLGGVQAMLETVFAGISVDVVVEPVKDLRLANAIQRDRLDAF